MRGRGAVRQAVPATVPAAWTPSTVGGLGLRVEARFSEMATAENVGAAPGPLLKAPLVCDCGTVRC